MIKAYLVGAPPAGLIRPVGVRGRDVDEPLTGVPIFRPETLLCRLDVGVLPVVPTVLRGIRLGVPDSSDKTNITFNQIVFPIGYLFKKV